MFTRLRIYQSKILICIVLVIFISVALLSCATKKNTSGQIQVVPDTTAMNKPQAKTTETPAPSVQKEKEDIVHIVQKGETLSIIAKQYNVTVDAIVRLNNIADANFIKVGQKIIIPGQGAGEQK
jgi:LysM repeat protein